MSVEYFELHQANHMDKSSHLNSFSLYGLNAQIFAPIKALCRAP